MKNLPAKNEKKVPPKRAKNCVQIYTEPEETEDMAAARCLMKPQFSAASTIQAVHGGDLLDVNNVAAQLMHEAKAVNAGSLARSEEMLVCQMHSLDAIYNKLARLGDTVLLRNIDQGETLFRLAFKAQSQCRATVEALAEIKNPRQVAFVKQANIAGGNQQVNNGTTDARPSVSDTAKWVAEQLDDIPSRTEESKMPPNKLLGD